MLPLNNTRFFKMKIKLFIFYIIIAGVSCTSSPEKKGGNAMDTGRDFIRATLDGDFKSAEPLLLQDPQNTQLFDSYKKFYERLPAEKKEAYKKASYNINTYKDENDSMSVINYSNTYMKEPMNIKLVKRADKWFVDFKFTSEDTTQIK